jgi:hypothetical protein
MATEKVSDYEQLFAYVADAIRPKAAPEWILTKDYVDLEWEILRFRRARAAIIDVTRKEALRSILESILDQELLQLTTDRFTEAAVKADDWYLDETYREEIRQLMSRHGLDEDAITAQAIALRARELEKIDDMLASAERRRNSMLKEVILYREVLSAHLGEIIDVIEGNEDDLSIAPPSN